MRAGLEALSRRWWAGDLGAAGTVLSALATPLSWTWVGAAHLVGAAGAARAERVEGVVVVSVGNLAVGGTGKTPLAAWTASKLAEAGARPAVLVGGAGADEARLHRRRLPGGVPVVVDRDRRAGARRARALGADTVVLDDGFQHRRLRRDLDVVLLAAEDAFPGRRLPSGPYREGPRALARADVVLVTRRRAPADAARRLADRVGAYAPAGVLGGVELTAAAWTDLVGVAREAPRGDVLAACGVARPETFRASVARELVGSVELVAFADHHDYSLADVERLKATARRRPIVITEKDAVKIEGLVGTDAAFRVLEERVRWDWGEQAFLARLREQVTAARS